MIQNRFLIKDQKTSFTVGLDWQREQFKAAKFQNDYDSMCDAIENIKSEIKFEVIKKNKIEKIQRIEKIINWYRTLETNFIVNTPDGKKVVFPPDIHNKVNQNLTIAYELLIIELRSLDLL